MTILVGENSAGKSSFLAMVKALWDLYHNHQVPNFNEDPFDFGTFDNIVSAGYGEEETGKAFHAGFKFNSETQTSNGYLPTWFGVEFEKKATAPFPVKLTIASAKKLKLTFKSRGDDLVQMGIQTKRGSWKSKEVPSPIKLFESNRLTALPFILNNMKPINLASSRVITFSSAYNTGVEYISESSDASTHISENDWYQIDKLLWSISMESLSNDFYRSQPYASSPVRSKPKRIYQPKLFSWDSEGNFAPMYLAHLFETEKEKWDELKDNLERFGSQSGLFNKISIHRFGESDGGPFQVEVQKFGKQNEGKNRNLIDIGYGVSQILPVATELLRHDPAPLLLLQQPEVHLHPSAQAALGSLLLQTARKEQIVIVESHSDHLLNRIRMDVRDQVTDCKPEDVSILYFENSDLETKIHSLGIDEQGNVMGAPQSYGRFFMDETRRSLRL